MGKKTSTKIGPRMENRLFYAQSKNGQIEVAEAPARLEGKGGFIAIGFGYVGVPPFDGEAVIADPSVPLVVGYSRTAVLHLLARGLTSKSLRLRSEANDMAAMAREAVAKAGNG